MIKHLKFTTVPIRDQQRALDFFVRTLGFEKRRDDHMGDARWIEVAPPGSTSAIVLFTPPGFEHRIGTATGLVFACEDVPAYAEQLKARGVRFAEEPVQQPWGWWAQFKDADGNVFGLVETS